MPLDCTACPGRSPVVAALSTLPHPRYATLQHHTCQLTCLASQHLALPPTIPNPFSPGRLIHEFDPWFNYHATRYLFTHGAKKFFTWFDHTAWYPIGRPVGTTIYPGMQFTSVAIWHLLNRYLGIKMSLNDICVFVPAWFGAIASVLTGFLAAVRGQGPRGGAGGRGGGAVQGGLECCDGILTPALLSRS